MVSWIKVKRRKLHHPSFTRYLPVYYSSLYEERYSTVKFYFVKNKIAPKDIISEVVV